MKKMYPNLLMIFYLVLLCACEDLPLPLAPQMKMLTSAHICFSVLISVAKWTALSRASNVGAIPGSLGIDLAAPSSMHSASEV